MTKKVLILLLFFIFSFNISNAWWNSSWNYCRDIVFREISNISRLEEPVDLYIDSSNWDIMPNKNSIRIVDGGCWEIGNEINYGLWNETLINGDFLKSFNLLFQVNITEDSEYEFSIYYDLENKSMNDYSGIIWSFPRYDWKISTKKYDLDYSWEDYPGFKEFKYIYDGDINTNYAGKFAGGPLSIMSFPPNSPTIFIYNTSTCVGFSNHNLVNSMTCRVCYDSNIISCENNDLDGVFLVNNNLRDLFYDPTGTKNLYYRTNIDNEIKRSNLTHTSYKDHFRFGVANTTKGTNLIFVVTNGTELWNTKAYWYMVYSTHPLDNYGALPFLENSINWKRFWIAITNETLEEAYERAANWSIAIDYPLEDYVTIGPEQRYSEIGIISSFPLHNQIGGDIQITTDITHKNTSITNLTQDNFQIYLDNNSVQPQQFRNFNNGSYSFSIIPSPNILGSHQLEIEVNYNNETARETEEIILLTEPKSKVLIITDDDWKNYITAASTSRPVLVFESSRKLIDKFIKDYNPDQIFQLGVNLTFAEENYLVDSRETLIKTFFNNSDLIVPASKEMALKSSFIDLPILFDPSQETLDYLQPETIHNFTSLEQIDDMFMEKSPFTEYFILTDPNTDESKFSFQLAKNKDAFVILSSENSQQSKNKLVQEVNKFNLPESYYFDKELYLSLIGAPHFTTIDPVDNASQIITDTPYCDVNNDGYQDLSCGRLDGSSESLSYRIEYSELFKQDKTALILASYNTPGKYWDVIVAGGTMPGVIDTEVELLLKDFQVTKLVEKRSEFDQLNFSVLEKLNGISEKFDALDSATYSTFLSKLLGDFNKIILVARAGDTILYSIYEFDWRGSWKSILDLKPEYPEHLPVLNETNIIKEIKNNQVVFYSSKGNETHWFIPINSSFYSTIYDGLDPSSLDSNPLFYYLKYSGSFGIRDKFSDLGTLALVGITSDSYNIYSGQTAHNFFENFDQNIGKALLEARNRNYEISKMELNKNKIYEKEYYDTILFGDPSLSFDPALELKQSEDVEIKDGRYVITSSVKPDYYIIDYDGLSYVIFEDVDDYVVENNKPIIPVYRRTFTLPSDSNILGFSVDISNKTYDNVELPIIYPDPNYFSNETFTGVFPDEIYWNSSIMLLDNTTTFNLLFSPVVYYSNKTVQVIEEIEFSFSYDSLIDITKINSTDVQKGETEEIYLEIFNNLEQQKEANLLLKIETVDSEDIVRKQIILEPGKNTFSIEYDSTSSLGNYSVSAVLLGDGINAGPKYTNFRIEEKSFIEKILYPFSKIFKINYSGFFEQTRTFKEEYTTKKVGDRTTFDYVSMNITIHIEQNNKETVAVVKTEDGILTIRQKPMILEYNLSSPRGSLLIFKEKGQIRQEINGDEKYLRNLLNSIMESYKKKVEELGLTS